MSLAPLPQRGEGVLDAGPGVPRVLRGGDVNGSSNQLRSGYRTDIKDNARFGNRGLRCARDKP